MHETPDEVSTLQRLLDNSYRAAGSHLLSIHTPERRMSAEDICDTLKKVCVLDLATVNRRNEPMVAPVDGLFLGGQFWFGSSKHSIRFKHIRNNPNISAAYTIGEQISMLIHGVAEEIDVTTGNYERLHEYCREIYGAGYDDWGYWGNEPFALIKPKRFYAMKMPPPEEQS